MRAAFNSNVVEGTIAEILYGFLMYENADPSGILMRERALDPPTNLDSGSKIGASEAGTRVLVAIAVRVNGH
jgi:hypothetical protein